MGGLAPVPPPPVFVSPAEHAATRSTMTHKNAKLDVFTDRSTPRALA
jgi:hypothetical protein